MDYELIENITRADTAVRVKGLSLEEIFFKGAGALISEMLENPCDIKRIVVRESSIPAPDRELLYCGFLNEILFFKDAEGLLLLPESLEIKKTCDGYTCSFSLSGEKISRDRHKFRVDVKAVTLHGLKIYSDGEFFIAESVFDV